MNHPRRGKGARFANTSRQALAKGVIPALNVRCFARFFANRGMVIFRNNGGVCLPEITLTRSCSIGCGDRPPERATCGDAPITNGRGTHVACFPTEGNPYPRLLRLLIHERPAFITFTGRGIKIMWIGWYKR